MLFLFSLPLVLLKGYYFLILYYKSTKERQKMSWLEGVKEKICRRKIRIVDEKIWLKRRQWRALLKIPQRSNKPRMVFPFGKSHYHLKCIHEDGIDTNQHNTILK